MSVTKDNCTQKNTPLRCKGSLAVYFKDWVYGLMLVASAAVFP